MHISKIFSSFIDNEGGVTAIEYCLIAALIALAAVIIMGTIGTNLSTVFSEVASSHAPQPPRRTAADLADLISTRTG
jgi:pilus assembly protein Flp/PilA